MTQSSEWITAAELCEMLKISMTTLWRHSKNGPRSGYNQKTGDFPLDVRQIPTRRVGKRVLYKKSVVEELLNE